MSRSPSLGDVEVDVESLDLDANGVARHDGKVVFVRGALPGERVQAKVVRRKPRFEVAETTRVLRESSARATPRCPHFGVCGGCSMQHLDPRAQLAIKQRAMEDQFTHIARLKPETMLRAIAGPTWGYRYRARLGVRDVPKKGGVLVGFHERGSSYVADMRECLILPPRVSAMLVPMRDMVAALSIRRRMPQIEVAIGDETLALVLRVLDPPTAADGDVLRRFATEQDCEIWLQHKGPDTITLFATPDPAALAAGSTLAYRLDEFGIRMPFRPTDFTQVNHQINAVLVSRAVRLLAPEPGDRVADLFCGLGNFSLPLARRAREVLGIEGSATLVRRAADNAAANGLADRARFEVANLFDMDLARWQSLGAFDRALIDPPREGALELSRAIAADPHRLKRIVYVSCNPATLARDAALLVHQGGYRLMAAGAINMFPHTSHVESMAVFEPGPDGPRMDAELPGAQVEEGAAQGEDEAV